jgi:uncharacterized protein (DUF1697 family)
MISVISMLRGVNVGGHNLIKMEELRTLYESLGLRQARTYVQSGNVVFRAKEQNPAQLGKRIEDAIGRQFGFRPGVILRTASEMNDVVARNPFAGRGDVLPGKLLVIFLGCDPDAAMREAVSALAPPDRSPTARSANTTRTKRTLTGEELWMDGREVFIYFPDGQGRSKLVPALERALKKSGTGRNWNTVTKLVEMAESLENP